MMWTRVHISGISDRKQCTPQWPCDLPWGSTIGQICRQLKGNNLDEDSEARLPRCNCRSRVRLVQSRNNFKCWSCEVGIRECSNPLSSQPQALRPQEACVAYQFRTHWHCPKNIVYKFGEKVVIRNLVPLWRPSQRSEDLRDKKNDLTRCSERREWTSLAREWTSNKLDHVFFSKLLDLSFLNSCKYLWGHWGGNYKVHLIRFRKTANFFIVTAERVRGNFLLICANTFLMRDSGSSSLYS